MWWSSLALAATWTIPQPDGVDHGAVCTFELTFADGEQSQVIVPGACPEPFHSAIEDHLAAEPHRPQPVPEQLALRVTFLPGREGGVVEPLASTPGAFARPLPGTALHLPEGMVRFKRQRSPKTPRGLRRPVVCRAQLSFDTEGMLTDHRITGCPPDLTTLTAEALTVWKVKPTWADANVAIRTDVTFTFGPS
jgi:hypothetical protein